MTIRRAKPEDYDAVMPLYTGLVKSDERFKDKGNDSFTHMVAEPTAAVFVAEDDGKIIGIGSVSFRYVVRYPRPIAQLEELFVDSEARAHGVGKSLVEAAEAFARENNCIKFYIESGYQHEPAHEFYQHRGYSKDGFYFSKVL